MTLAPFKNALRKELKIEKEEKRRWSQSPERNKCIALARGSGRAVEQSTYPSPKRVFFRAAKLFLLGIVSTDTPQYSP